MGSNPKLSLTFKIVFCKFISYRIYFSKLRNKTSHNLFTQPELRVPGFFSLLIVGIVPDTDYAWDGISLVWLPLWQKAKQKQSFRLQNFPQGGKDLQFSERAVSSQKFCPILMSDKAPKTVTNANLNDFIRRKTLLKFLTDLGKFLKFTF